MNIENNEEVLETPQGTTNEPTLESGSEGAGQSGEESSTNPNEVHLNAEQAALEASKTPLVKPEVEEEAGKGDLVESDDPESDATADGEGFSGKMDVVVDGVGMTVGLPEDVATKFTEAGIDCEELLTDIFKDDKFELSDEHMGKLSEMYGAGLVDSYMKGLQAQTKIAVNAAKEFEQKVETENAKIWDATLEQVGGEENWDTIVEWLPSNTSEEELAELNTIMESGSRLAQRLTIDDLKARYEAAEGTLSPQLVLPDSKGEQAPSGILSADQYKEILMGDEYDKDPERYDAMRQAGIKRGI